MTLIPSRQKELVGEEIPNAPLLHLPLLVLQEVSKPLKSICLSAQPVEVDLESGSKGEKKTRTL